MKVLLINTNREKSPQTVIPLGVCCVASAVEAAGHEVEVLDLCFERKPVTAVENRGRTMQPDVIGLSIRNLDNCNYMAPHGYLPEVASIVEACRKASNAKIVLGGSAVSQAPDAVLAMVGGDFAVVGEGEGAFVELLSSITLRPHPNPLPQERGLGDVPSLQERKICNGSSHILESILQQLPDPSPSRWLDLRKYRAYDAAMPVQSKRGCAMKCSYCAYPALEGSEWRLREPEWVAGQVVEAKKVGMRMVDFVDSVFGLPQHHAIACCKAIARETNGQMPLSTMDLNPLACTPELIDAMNTAGFTAVGVTADSGSGVMLETLQKGFDLSHLKRAADNLRKLDAQKIWIFLLGAPGENEQTVQDTVRFIEELPENNLVMITHGIRVLPRTAIQQSLIESGYIRPDDDLIQPTFYYSPDITPQQAQDILASCSFPSANIVTLTDGGHKLAPIAQRVATMLGMKPPYWRHIPIINRVRKMLERWKV